MRGKAGGPETGTKRAKPVDNSALRHNTGGPGSAGEDTYTLAALVARSFRQSVAKGFYDNPRSVGDLLMLIVTEVAEAFEEYRNGSQPGEIYKGADDKPEGVPVELADVCIRIFDFCGRYDIDLEAVIVQKLDYNLTRSFKHGGKRL